VKYLFFNSIFSSLYKNNHLTNIWGGSILLLKDAKEVLPRT